jgi:hypothetical protein
MSSAVEFEESDDEDEEPTPSKKGNKTKKVKMFSGEGTRKTPLSKMTKAQVSGTTTNNAEGTDTA